jgi:hypothetical protein
MEEIKKKGRPSKKDNVLTKNAFEKKEDVPVVPLEEPKEAPKEVKEVPKEVPPTAPNTPVAPVVPIDMPKPKKERSAGQIEATKRMLEANKLKKGAKKEIIIKQDDLPDPVPIKEVVKPKAKPDARRANQNEVKPEPKAKPKKKEPVYESSEEESESSSEEYIQKYVNKAARKIQVVNSIEERLRQNAIPRNKYSNLSIFS